MTSVSVMEGDSATPNIDFSTRGGRIMWMFGSKCSGIAYITHTSSYLDSERFGDRLKLVPGSLAIRNMTTTGAGLYYLNVTDPGGEESKTFNVTDCSECFVYVF